MIGRTMKDLAEWVKKDLPTTTQPGPIYVEWLKRKYPEIQVTSKPFRLLMAMYLSTILPPFKHLSPQLTILLEESGVKWVGV